MSERREKYLSDMFILLSPAKTFDFDFRLETDHSTKPQLIDCSAKLIKILREYSPEQISKLMKVSAKIADLNFGRYKTWSPTGSHHALWAFAGDVYRGLEAQDFTAEEVAFAQQHVGILSGLYGLLRPLDMIDPYRLEMGTKLSNPRGKNLYEFWGSQITNLINQHSPSAVINLASNEYASALQWDDLEVPSIEVVFQEQKGSERKVIGIHAKKARGMMTRYVVKHQITTPEGLKDFDGSGYQFDAQSSDGARFIFVR